MRPAVIPWPDPPIIAAIIAALGVSFGAWLTWLASGARDLRGRIDTLEGRIAKIEEERDSYALLVQAMATFINRLGVWVEAGADRKRKPKPPPQIAAHIDAEPWMPDPEDVRG